MTTMNKDKFLRVLTDITDDTPLLLIDKDSALNNKIAAGLKFNKRVKVGKDASPDQDYMGSGIDLTFPAGPNKNKDVGKT